MISQTSTGLVWGRAQPEEPAHPYRIRANDLANPIAALARWTFVGLGFARAGIWLSPIFVGMVHDWIARRRIHPVYTIGSIALFLFGLRLLVAGSESG